MVDTEANLLRCVIVTPQRPVADETADFVVFTAHDGQFGVLLDRAPLMCELGCGFVRIDHGEQHKWYYIAAGFAQVAENRIVIAAGQATAAEDLDTEELTEKLAQIKKAKPPAGRQEIAQTRAKLTVAKRAT